MKRMPRVTKFQFHKGTIKTSSRMNNLPGYLYFNSIKVRLKPQLQKASFIQKDISIP